VGIAERFRQAAEAARSTLQDREPVGDPSAIRGTQREETADVDLAWRTRALGAPDPYSLISHDEIAAITGIPVGPPSIAFTDDDLGVRFEARNGLDQLWSFGVHAGHAVDESTPFDPVTWYEWMVALLDRATPVAGVGDAAVFQAPRLLYVRGAGRAFYVLIDAPDASPVRLWATLIARRVIQRFVSGEAG
jgi:hypothetical protein